MPRIPYKADDPDDRTEAEIRARRGGALLNLDRMLLHSPPYAGGWNGLLKTVRGQLSVPPKLRELAICVVALRTGAEYELQQHAPEFLKEGGTGEQLQALRSPDPAGSGLFSAVEQSVIRLAVEMTADVRVQSQTFSAVRSHLSSDREVVELVGIIATFNMVSRFLVALEVDLER